MVIFDKSFEFKNIDFSDCDNDNNIYFQFVYYLLRSTFHMEHDVIKMYDSIIPNSRDNSKTKSKYRYVKRQFSNK